MKSYYTWKNQIAYAYYFGARQINGERYKKMKRFSFEVEVVQNIEFGIHRRLGRCCPTTVTE